MSTDNQNNNQLGAIWKKTSQAGNDFYSGTITIDGKEVQIVLFKNDRKEIGSKQPDWRIYESAPRPANKQTPEQPRPAARQNQSGPPPSSVRQPYQRRTPAPQQKTPAPAASSQENEAPSERTM